MEGYCEEKEQLMKGGVRAGGEGRGGGRGWERWRAGEGGGLRVLIYVFKVRGFFIGFKIQYGSM